MFLNGYALHEEPCTDPYARFCGQTEASASSDPIILLNDEIESPLTKIKKLRDARTDRAERILLALKDGDYSFLYDMEPIRGELLVEVCANLDRHLQEQAIDLHIKSIEQVIGLQEKLKPYQKGPDVKALATKEKWHPYQIEYNALVTDGMKSSVALNKIGNKIEAAIKENPAQTDFKKRPDRTTLLRQLVQQRK